MSLQALSKRAARPALAAHARALTASAPRATDESYSHHQKSLGRPISPHVTIYKMPVAALSSITNRFATMGMAFAFTAGGAASFVGVDIQQLLFTAQDVIPGFAPVSKVLVAFPVSYHMLTAARHAVWTRKPELINNSDGPKSAYALVGASVALSLGAAAVTLKRDE